MTDGIDETWSLAEMSVARRRPWSVVALFHARATATGNARSPRVDRRVDGTSIVGESTERRRRRAANSDVSCRLSARYAGAVPCTQRYARTHSRCDTAWEYLRQVRIMYKGHRVKSSNTAVYRHHGIFFWRYVIVGHFLTSHISNMRSRTSKYHNSVCSRRAADRTPRLQQAVMGIVN